MPPVSVRNSQSAKSTNPSTKLWILLIGINQYQDSHLPDLEYSALDCQELEKTLIETPQQNFTEKIIKSYHNFSSILPTLKAIQASLKEIVTQAKSQDTILFYFSGHGLLDSKSRQAILCLQDTQKDDPLQTGLSLSALLTSLSQCPASQQLVWLDACHSGGFNLSNMQAGENSIASELNPTAQLVKTLQNRAANGKRFYALLSCDQGQQSWEFPELNHGVFTHYLMRGLRGEAANNQGVIDADGLYRYVYYQTLQYIDKTNQQLRLINQQKRSRGEKQLQPEYPLQTPKRIVEGVGEIILGQKPVSSDKTKHRTALFADGLGHYKNSLKLRTILQQEGEFRVEYRQLSIYNQSELLTAIQNCLKSQKSTSLEQDSFYKKNCFQELETALLYLRGQIEKSETGESCLVFANQIQISLSWLRQELRKSTVAQQIIILDCPGSATISEWVDELQIDSEKGQCIIAASAPIAASEQFTQALIKTLENINSQVGLPAAGWISRLQLYLAGTPIQLHLWLSGTRGIIEIIPSKIGRQDSEISTDLGLCPYKGLQAFTAEDAQFFYGRKTLTQQLINQLTRHSFLAVIGASGSGKSSVVHAGLIVQLSQGKQLPRSEKWWIKSVRPGAYPLETLSWQLLDTKTETEKESEQLHLEGMLYQGVEGFVRWLRSRPEPMVVLIVDQFEEIFTLANSQDRKRYLEILLGALEYASDRFKLVFVLRADFISSCLEMPALAQALQRSNILVPPYLTPEDYRQAIVMPAQTVGLQVEPELVEVLLQELHHSAGDLPLLEFVLEQLWENRGAGKLTLDTYQHKIGGIKGALERKAQAVYESLDAQSQACVQWIFLALTQLGEGKEDTRRRVFKSDLIVQKYPKELVESTLQTLTDAKLIVMNLASGEKVAGKSRQAQENANSEEVKLQALKQEVTIEVVHEVLIRHWSTLRWWLDENRTHLRVQRQLIHAANLWKDNNKQPEFLLHGVRLAEAEEQYIKYTDELSDDVQKFIEACLEARIQQQLQAKKRLRQAQTAVAIISILALGALGLGGVAYRQSQKAQLREIEALNSLAEKDFSSHQQLDALVNSIKAAKQLQNLIKFKNILTPTISTEIQNTTHKNLKKIVENIQEYNRLESHKLGVIDAVYSHNGQIIASASLDKTIKLWHRDGRLIRTLTGHDGSVYRISFSPDDQILASVSADETIKLWRVSDGQLLRTLKGHTNEVTSINFSPDGKTIASSSKDNKIKLWNTQTGRLLKTLTGHTDHVMSVRFSPVQITTFKGVKQVLISADADGKIKLWNVSTGQLLKTIYAHNDWINALSISPNGQLIASASADDTIKLWSSRDGTLVNILKEHTDEVNSVNFSPDGQTIISGSRDKAIKLWSSRDGVLLNTLYGHTESVQSVSFSLDGQMIVSAGRDQTIRLWKNQNRLLLNTLVGHQERLESVSFSTDGQMIATASNDDMAKVWNSHNQTLLYSLKGHTAVINSVSFSPDSQLIATASADGTIKIWNSLDGSLIQTFQADNKAEVLDVSFSSSGQILASASRDQTIRLWRRNNTNKFESQPYEILRGNHKAIQRVTFSLDDKIIASANQDGTIALWKTQSRTLYKIIQGHTDTVQSVRFSPNGEMIVSASQDGTIKFWNREGQLLKNIPAHNGAVWDVRFSSDGQIIASSGEDKTVKLWNLKGQLLNSFEGHGAGVTSISFSPNQLILASASRDSTVKLWNLSGITLNSVNLEHLLRQGCDWLYDYLITNPKLTKQEQHLCLDLEASKIKYGR